MSSSGSLELWGGVECTVNRVGDEYFDQLQMSGHARRISDFDLFIDLGIKALRYPVLWERTQPTAGGSCNWSWSDERLNRLQRGGVRPIVGLVHHGSGPRHTNLLDDQFAEGLAAYAGAVARRYPWVDAYTPVNEPLTTARFSALYGHWYPHAQDARAFTKALLAQCQAVVLAMRAIRQVNPSAKLLQTDDLGKTYSTPTLSYQADFENERRWITWDILSGRVSRQHSMWSYLTWAGTPEADLLWFVDNPCPPDVIGVNYYITSERFLDDRLSRYPDRTHGGNGRHVYADVEAVRVLADGIASAGGVLHEAWQRYGTPLAITEAHLGCTREEQMRWLAEVWTDAKTVRRQGVDVRAVTAWSLLGAYDWNCLLTRCTQHYEPGVFDLRSPAPRPTGLANLAAELGHGRRPLHPVLDELGWWRRPQRLLYPAVSCAARNGDGPHHSANINPRPIVITGGSGTLGKAFARICSGRGLSYQLLSRRQMDIADRSAVSITLRKIRPWAVINAAGYVRVDQAEADPERCFRENALGPATLAEACADFGIAFVTFSSDLVFDGQFSRPYLEADAPRPLNVYGHSKAAAEREVLRILPEAIVVRSSAFFGPWDDSNFVTAALQTLARGAPLLAAADATISPTYVPDLVNATLDLLVDGAAGVWHLSNGEPLTWADFAMRAASAAGMTRAAIEPCTQMELGYIARRPLYSALGSDRGVLLPGLEDALHRYIGDRAAVPADRREEAFA
jgi:dTDP-4-dehydrorhamnose reductase